MIIQGNHTMLYGEMDFMDFTTYKNILFSWFFRTPCDDVDSPELNKSLAERLLEKQRKAVKMCSYIYSQQIP